ncbi:MAG: lycopene cyclase family protein, partial [Bacteroidota bacterium]
MKQYDYIIAGAGCAGLSLLYRMLKEPLLQNKRILVIDKVRKDQNDRTWCFWEKGAGLFEPIVHHQWRTLQFLTENLTKQFTLGDYRYKMIRGIDFYHYALSEATKFENVDFQYEKIQKIAAKENHALVETREATYTAPYVFNSTGFFNPTINEENSLLQHFEGWIIKTPTPTFDSDVGTFMDFRLSQAHGDTFMYVFPMNAQEALVEYTLFSPRVLSKAEYKAGLEHYIKDFLKINDYEIVHREFGIVPMSLAKFPRYPEAHQRIINMGTAGGFTKASSGYTFQFIQRHAQFIIDQLKQGKSPAQKVTFRDKMFQWYDRTLLEVILSDKMSGKEVFAIMFKKLSPEKIFAFLDNDSTFLDELVIMNSVPKKTFITA